MRRELDFGAAGKIRLNGNSAACEAWPKYTWRRAPVCRSCRRARRACAAPSWREGNTKILVDFLENQRKRFRGDCACAYGPPRAPGAGQIAPSASPASSPWWACLRFSGRRRRTSTAPLSPKARERRLPELWRWRADPAGKSTWRDRSLSQRVCQERRQQMARNFSVRLTSTNEIKTQCILWPGVPPKSRNA